ncbi:uncharacterized protein LOC116710792 [Xiphophorus hellerii]|uniref:uncharacterized protein LOC116710792 n=1 Tax=Xiphophorus hellerii TaxID=8084 RepID=UPI0013B3E2E5|nr:uncharacterized protein LOC116710792 [Xiphophorus hellerii]
MGLVPSSGAESQLPRGSRVRFLFFIILVCTQNTTAQPQRSPESVTRVRLRSNTGSKGDNLQWTEARRFAADEVDGEAEEKGQRSFGVRKSSVWRELPIINFKQRLVSDRKCPTAAETSSGSGEKVSGDRKRKLIKPRRQRVGDGDEGRRLLGGGGGGSRRLVAPPETRRSSLSGVPPSASAHVWSRKARRMSNMASIFLVLSSHTLGLDTHTHTQDSCVDHGSDVKVDSPQV